MRQQLIECVPNFSEGNDMAIIRQITDRIESVDGVRLLDVDPGKATNRTVVTFVGPPEEVVEAAFRAVEKASELIDMRRHKGAHPRFGATDVCPLVPVSGITMEETVEYARKLAERIGEELDIPVYCYENAAFDEKRRNLAYCRSGEYEGLADKLGKDEWKPDFGRAKFNARSGAIAVGARDFLVAYNVNLNTTSTRRANAIAFDVREKGRVRRRGNPVTGEIVKDEKGNQVMIPGSLRAVKGIGWFIEEFGVAQVSLNLTNISITPVHIAYDEVFKKAEARGVRVTGSEIVGLIPLGAMIDAGKYFLKKQKRSVGVSEKELIKIAVKSMGLDDLYPFKPGEKIIEYVLAGKEQKKLVDMSLADFADETSSESPAPGGGSVSAAMGALGVALGTMVANLSSHKRGWDDRWEEFSEWAEKGRAIQEELIFLVDEDTRSFNAIMDAYSLPKKTAEEKGARTKAIEDATRYAAEVPLRIMQTSLKAFGLLKAMVETGNPNSVTDAGVGALAVRSCVLGASLNVLINVSGLDDSDFAGRIVAEAGELEKEATRLEAEILEMVRQRIG
ncbi:MAG: glutamate formimidoyltransferase [Marinilabiliales bacterium]|nr:MAG: glutamate formimidoyltransferase [Marinilabiliales bacterium]